MKFVLWNLDVLVTICCDKIFIWVFNLVLQLYEIAKEIHWNEIVSKIVVSLKEIGLSFDLVYWFFIYTVNEWQMLLKYRHLSISTNVRL